MLTAHHLHFAYGPRIVLDDVTLELAPGRFTALLGRNGTGKSTLLRLLAGMAGNAAYRGAVTLDKLALTAFSPTVLARRRAVLPQATPLAFDFMVDTIVALGRYPHRHAGSDAHDERRIIAAALALADAAGLAGRAVSTLSGGELARVHAARTFAQLWPTTAGSERMSAGARARAARAPDHAVESRAARYLLLDEPTAALDLAHQHALLATVRHLTRNWGIGALAIIHDPNLAARHADTMALLADGRILAHGPPNAIMEPTLLRACFGMDVRVLHDPMDGKPFAVPR